MKHQYIFILLYCLFCCCACEKALNQLSEDALDGLQFEVSTGVLHQPLTLQVLDELSGRPALGVKLEVLSSDFSTLYTNSGSKTLQLEDGLLTLGTLKRDAPSESAPRKVRFRFSAANYFVLEEEYLLTDTSSQLATVWMRPMRASAHVDVLENSFSAQRSSNLDFRTSNQFAHLQIDPYIEFRAGDHPLVGNLNLKMMVMPGTSANKNHLESILIRAPFRKADGSLGKFNLNPLSVVDIQVSSGSMMADQLSFPALLSVPINPDFYNPLTQTKIKNGDLIPAFWQKPNEGIWQAKSFATVSNRNGKLEATLPLAYTGRWALGFMELWPEENISELCQVFVQVQANMPDTLAGVYYRAGVPVPYHYTRKASMNFMQVFSSCRSGQGFDLDGLIRSVRETTRSYFLRQDSTVFADQNYQPNASIFVIKPLPVCSEYTYSEKTSIPVSVNADEATDGWLYYQIGSSSGYRFMRLNKGINNLQVAYPRHPLFVPGGFYSTQAQFTFYYEEACQLRSSTRNLPTCEVLNQGAILRVRPNSTNVLSSTELSINAACGGTYQAAIRPTLPVFFRSSCGSGSALPFKKLGEIRAGQLISNLPLRLGERYDFKIQYGNQSQELQGIRLGADSIGIGKFYRLSKNGRIRIHFGEIELPEGICRLIP